MVATALLNKLTTVCVDIPCCANFIKNNDTNDTKYEQAEVTPPPKTTKAPATFHVKKKSKFSGKESKYEDFKWVQLPGPVKKAATTLGYTTETWDQDRIIPHIDHKHWRDLTSDEKTQVQILGWDEVSWEHKYEHTNWADLPTIVQEAATELGFSPHMWDHDEWPETIKHSEWHSLGKQQQLYLHVLGYTEETW